MRYKVISLRAYLLLCSFNFACSDSNLPRYFIYTTSPTVSLKDVAHDSMTLEVHVPGEGYPSDTKDSTGYHKPPSYFVVQYREESQSAWQNPLTPLGQPAPLEQIYNLWKLKPDTSYSIRVIGCYNLNDQSDLLKITSDDIKIVGTYSTTCKPLEVISIKSASDSVEIAFKKEELSCKPENYDFNILNAPEDRIIELHDKSSNSLRIRGLEPAKEYEFVGKHIKNPKYSITKTFRTSEENDLPTGPDGHAINLFIHSTRGNTYHFKWTIPNKGVFGTITSFTLSWAILHKACPPQTVVEENAPFSPNENEFQMELEPYAEYNFTLNVHGSERSGSSSKEGISTNFEENIDHEEIPNIEFVDADKTSVDVVFRQLDCKALKGPLLLNYKAFGNEYWCDSIKLKEISNIAFPFDNSHRFRIPSLTAYCTYTIKMYVSRLKDDWESARPLDSVTVHTKSIDIAEKIEDLRVTSRGKDHIYLRWLPSTKPNGFLKEYRISLTSSTSKNTYSAGVNTSVNPCTLWPEYQCHDVRNSYIMEKNTYNISIVGINQNSLNNSALKKAIEYAIRRHRVEYVEVYTEESVSGEPYDVKASWIDEPRLNVSWKHPNGTNGILKLFKIWKTFLYDSAVTDSISFPLNDGREDYRLEYYQLIDLSLTAEQHPKSLKVSITAHNIAGMSDAADVPIPYPPAPKEYTYHIKMNGLVLRVPKPDFDGFFESLHIFKAESLKNKDDSHEAYASELNYIESLLEKPISEKVIRDAGKINQWVYTYKRGKKHLENNIIKIDGSQGLFRNETAYNVSLFIVNELNGGRRVKRKTVTVKTTTSTDTTTASNYATLKIVLGLLFVLPCLAYLGYRYRRKIFLPTTALGDALVLYSEAEDVTPLTFVDEKKEEAPTNKDKAKEIVRPQSIKPVHSKRVKIENLRNYIKSALENLELHRQHELFLRSDVLMLKDKRFSCSYGSLPQNKAKNRYNKIVAYDHTRVKLNKLPGDEYSDYINANYINGYRLPRAYIATQGPKKNTLNDFWGMIWEQNVKNIVMLTKLYEGDRKDCEKYWPDENEQMNFNGIIVEFVNITRHPTYDIRELKVCFGADNRKISQIQFKSWPAVGQPLYPQTLVPLLQNMLTLPYVTRTPILVHCSAGIGRTGTVILCDICLRMAAAEGTVDILGMLELLRTQRPNMVDNVEQYKLAHLVILACLTAWDTSIPCDGNFESIVEGLLEDGVMPTQMAYLRESEWQDDAMKATLPEERLVVAGKNRYPDILPEESYQIFLQPLPNLGRTSSYINAIRVNSFSFPDRYVITQQPLPGTVSDFWRMVVEQQCTVVINLNDINSKDETSVPFWPEQEAKMNLKDGIDIEYVKTQNAKEFSILTVRLSYRPNAHEQTKLTVEILNFKAWNNHLVIPENMDDFVSFVVDSTVICRKSHPVIITCHDGATACGLFVASSNLIEQMKLEKECNVCRTVRTIRNCRKQFMNKEIQLGFLYNAAVFYQNNFGVYHELEN